MLYLDQLKELERKLGYKPNALFLGVLEEHRDKERKKFCDPFLNEKLRHMPDPFVMSLMGSVLSSNIGAVITSAATITITNALHRISGSTQNTLVKIPTGFRGVFAHVNTDASPHTTATGGTYAASDGTVESLPYQLATTVVRYKTLLIATFDGLILNPSY